LPVFHAILQVLREGSGRGAARRRPEKGPSTGGQVPEEDQRHPPRAAPGSRNLPWDTRRIPTNATRRQGSAASGPYGWDGGLACVRDVGGGIGPGSGTSGTAKIPSVCGWCVVGRRRSGNGSVGRGRRRVSSMSKRSVPDGSKFERGAGRLLVRMLFPWRRLCPWARGHAAKPPFHACCATDQAVTNLPGTAGGRRRSIVAMRAVRPCGGRRTVSASTWPARRKPVGSNAAWSITPRRRSNPRCRRPDKALWVSIDNLSTAGQELRSAAMASLARPEYLCRGL
jgi:hypothetical protein